MDRKYEKRTGSFVARKSNGEDVIVQIWTTFIESATRAGTDVLEGTKRLRTDDGDPVNRLDKGKYQLVGFNAEEITSNDPNAP